MSNKQELKKIQSTGVPLYHARSRRVNAGSFSSVSVSSKGNHYGTERGSAGCWNQPGVEAARIFHELCYFTDRYHVG
jgi:hypothetical protein